MPMPPAWCWWLNCTGCSTNWLALVTKSERCSVSTSQPTPSSAKTMAMMLPFDHALALFGNTCDMRFQQPLGLVGWRLHEWDERRQRSSLYLVFRARDSCEKFLKLIVCC